MSPAAFRLRLLRDLDEAIGRAYCGWPGEPPTPIPDEPKLGDWVWSQPLRRRWRKAA